MKKKAPWELARTRVSLIDGESIILVGMRVINGGFVVGLPEDSVFQIAIPSWRITLMEVVGGDWE